MVRRPGSSGRGSRGFVLAVTLWLLAGIAVIVGAMTLWAFDEVRAAADERERTEDRLSMLSTQETVLYLAATRDLTFGGLPVRAMADDERALRLLEEFGALKRDPVGDELRLDSRPYAGLDGTTFALQDEAGLFALVWPAPDDVDRLLIAHDVDRNRVPRLRDALLDYIDPDPLRRLNGAEEGDYADAGMAPPPGRRLLLPPELSRVYGWSGLSPAQWQALVEHVSPYYTGAVNLNTVPAGLLHAWIAGCPEKCQLLEEMRNRRVFRSSSELQAMVGVRLAGDDAVDYRYLASENLRLTFWGRSGSAWRMHVRLTPLADEAAPWAVLAAYPVPRPADAARSHPPEGDLFPDPSSRRR